MLTPRLLETTYTPNDTNILIGFEIGPLFRHTPERYVEIYDIRLFDQNGRSISGISTTRLPPDQAEAQFAPLGSGVSSLTLQADFTLGNIPADNLLVVDIAGHRFGESWPIQAVVRFGDQIVALHTAQLAIQESGMPPNEGRYVQIELWGDNLQYNSAQLQCLRLIPQGIAPGGGMSCGKDDTGISASVDLTPVVDRNTPLQLPEGPLVFEVMAEFLLLDSWEFTWQVER
jgi:hypothetical protein